MTLQVERTSPTTLVCTRFFAAPPSKVYAAHTEPAIIRRWLLGPDGWSMPVCEHEARVGGKVRYQWKNDVTGDSFSLTAHYELVEAPHRLIHVEVMHIPDPTPENRVETRFDAEGKGTRMTMTMNVDDAATMDAMIATGMTDGMEKSYARLEAMA
jgi:uncharacterized protein YndB with AHSA1/START domain